MKKGLSLPTNEKCKIAVIGLGYVGLPLAIEFSKNSQCLITRKKLERKVIGYDINKKRINGLINFNDYTNQFSKKELKDLKNIEFTAEEEQIKEADVFIITVPTPIDEFNIPDLKALKEASILVGKALSKKTNKFKSIVIYESTVFPGVTEDVCIPLLSKFSNLKINEDYFCGYSPERINPGDKKHTLTNIVKITSGSNKEAGKWIDLLYGSIINAGTFRVQSIKIAETAKIIENTQRDINIALMNELSIICNLLKIDTLDVIEAASTKWNFLPFKPGLVGGHCIGVDPYYLTYKSNQLGYEPLIVSSGRKINDKVSDRLVDRIILKMVEKSLFKKGLKILILGITFKEDCPDMRNSKVFDILKNFSKYPFKLKVVDPYISEDTNIELDIEYSNDISFEESYEAVLLLVAHEKFANLTTQQWSSLIHNDSLLFDLKGIVPRSLKPIRI